MNKKIKQEMNKIEIPKDLSERSKLGVSQAKREMTGSRKRWNVKGIGIAAALVVAVGAFALFINNSPDNTAGSELVINEDGSVDIPAIEIPKDTSNASMIGLIVYNGKIYTQTSTEIEAENAKVILGEKLGTTKGTIDEWSSQDAYDKGFASTIGKADVYAVKGYDKEFRIMAYLEQDGQLYAEYFENLNGITVDSGNDIFGKLNMDGNVTSAQYRTLSDWDNSIENYQPITDMETLNTFVAELDKTKPLPRSEHSDPIGDSRTDEQFRELLITINDGSTVSLKLLKDGYIYYGSMAVYFQMDEVQFSKMWSLLE
ncbi:hypothetical protein [Ornithinibacillus californiensis]|uniref:hypothetical protein n=1 Tax=Ornithinibacillus californiensis TaxID=161536 RepID=UPI00064DD450|nr:hypothetical protein [Ornithinibacillus californiensis]